MSLTQENYYQDTSYMTNSLFKAMKKDEIGTLAKIKGLWNPEENKTALLVGNYVHSYFESKEAHDRFKEANQDDMMTKSGKLKADFKVAEKMIHRLTHRYDVQVKDWVEDNTFQRFYTGDKEVIVTGQVGGVDFKGKIDCLNLEKGYFVDLKTTRSIREKQWSDELHKKVSFIRNYEYHRQLALYQELIRQTFGKVVQPFIVAVSKESQTDVQVFNFSSEQDKELMSESLEEIKELAPRFRKVLDGEIEPKKLDTSDFVKATRSLSMIMQAEELETD
ncbi:PD-(D/E)XK nuclease-like domain-containing protein [Holzapfeliella sp. He02]|uniref:PD-(D/E)XK nuclease-like domain-containing protein n=1 Tax=Holzapfeliella saturejae TaxID=3082953 RepID=A0ABU8SHE4_9LACO